MTMTICLSLLYKQVCFGFVTVVEYSDPSPTLNIYHWNNQFRTSKRSLRRFLPKVRIGLAIVIQVRSGVRAPSSFTSHQYNFTLSNPVEIISNFTYRKWHISCNKNSTKFKGKKRTLFTILTHLRNMPTPAPQVAACAVQAPTSSPSSWLRQQELWEHNMAPQNRHKVGCFLSSSVDLGHLRTKRTEHLQKMFY